jgi:hypothetical protein
VVTPFFHALLLLTVLGAAVFTASAVRGWQSIGAIVGGYIAALVWVTPLRLPDPVWVGCMAAILAALQLFRPRYGLVSAAFGGALAALCGPLGTVLGIAAPAGAAFGAAEAAIVASLSFRRPEFAPRPMRDEALLGIVGLGTLVALMPGVMSGWQTALALNIEDKGSMNQVVPGWTLTVGIMAVVSGGLYALWRHR